MMEQEIFKLIQIPIPISKQTVLLDTNYILDEQQKVILVNIKSGQKWEIDYQIRLDQITGISKYRENTYYLVEQFQNAVQIYRMIITSKEVVVKLMYKTEMQRFCYQLNDLKDRRMQQHKARIKSGYFKYSEVYVSLYNCGLLSAMQNLTKCKNQDCGFVNDYFVKATKDLIEISKENSLLSLDELVEQEEGKVLQRIQLPNQCTQVRNGLLKVGEQLFQLQ
ncbi:unnamed protein product (macronuclear) [Paramecium tetraurelia]|uniref:Uncharacterized protein n=1 Tax=Paramecium tetraurelia TaxID=5888 RepID=A0BEG8_PARTE|nr:uncharacterized protein GSPATT00027968001 [Paramecium tetraurelia]CAK56935.1 unnamed protein product [Paramecium tetraurelia]|eukprot:XP_001424333.1 hypothetical protein (macronuclear) [Paramecium tetraurelia strain d4-2]